MLYLYNVIVPQIIIQAPVYPGQSDPNLTQKLSALLVTLPLFQLQAAPVAVPPLFKLLRGTATRLRVILGVRGKLDYSL